MSSYIIYCRKSTESEERQVLSIESQIKELNELATRLNLPVSEVLTESRSAKQPGRPVFNYLMSKILKREVKGIISWKLDRIARNPIDGGNIAWALDQGQIVEIITPSHHLRNNSNDKFIMQLEFGMAKKYVDDLSDNVRRGLRMKLEKGWRPGRVPLGYLNEPMERTVVPDPVRFSIVKKMWDLFLQGTPPFRIHQIASNELGLRRRIRHGKSGNAVTLSTVYKLFVNPFYYGIIKQKGITYQGKHQPMISEVEFRRAQELLGMKGIPRPKTHIFAFTGLMKCGECGCSITAETKTNHYGRHYTYYRCTKKKELIKCSQKAIQEKDLESQMNEYLEKIHLSKRFLEIGLNYLEKATKQELDNKETYKLSIEKAHQACERKLENLRQMRMNDLISDEEYMTEKRKLTDEKIRLEQNLANLSHGKSQSGELTKETFMFSHDAKEKFINGTPLEKKSLIGQLGSNFLLKDKKLSINVAKPFQFIQTTLNILQSENGRIELPNNAMNSESIGSRDPQFLLMWALVQDVRTYYENQLKDEIRSDRLAA